MIYRYKKYKVELRRFILLTLLYNESKVYIRYISTSSTTLSFIEIKLNRKSKKFKIYKILATKNFKLIFFYVGYLHPHKIKMIEKLLTPEEERKKKGIKKESW